LQDDFLIASPKFKYCEETRSGKAVFIGVPALDENEQSNCPKRYSSETLRKKRDNMSKFLWMCVYQQTPIAPEGLEFDYATLKQYDELPETTARYATLDPARRGKNYVSMPILYRIKGEENQFALVDFLYRKKSMKELYDDIVDKIIEHRLNYLLVENNTDTSLKMVLEEKLHQKGYFGCTLEEKYSTENKEQRIKDNQGYVRGNIVYPRKGMFPPNTDMGMAMDSMTSYSFEYPNKFDDAIDSIVLFVMKYIDKADRFERVKTFSRAKLGI
jgi:predicted phage terminase large subunit-like protein